MKKEKVVRPTLPKGTRDFLPAVMHKRLKIISTVKNIFEKYGYEPLETSAIEKLEVLTGKYGQEGERLIFKILKRGEKLSKSISRLAEEALRYDLTVPLCRVMAMYPDEIKLPFKRYQIQPVWRADKPQKGRYREFYQCDVDIVGTSSMLADAEVLAITYEILTSLGFEKFVIKLNNRKLLSGIAEYSEVNSNLTSQLYIALDKMDQIGKEGVEKELRARKISSKIIKRLLPLLEIKGSNESILMQVGEFLKNSKIGNQGINELQEIISYLRILKIPEENYAIDLYLARGLEYYTGPIFESVVEEPKIGSLTGGGRYDNLIGIFMGKDIPATGTTIGLERIIDVMADLKMLGEVQTQSQVLVTCFTEKTLHNCLELANLFRKENIKAEIYFNITDSLRDQLGYASSKGIPVVTILGERELSSNQVVIKDLKKGTQQSLDVPAVVSYIKSLLVE